MRAELSGFEKDLRDDVTVWLWLVRTKGFGMMSILDYGNPL